MNLKSLLIGSAAATVLATGAQAADAIVYADPEPMEYVRICDVYGAGFYYIPGTETCLKIGGYVRFETAAGLSSNVPGFQSGYATYARFALQPDARSETEWGTLRAYADAWVQYSSSFGQGAILNEGYIELIGASGTLRIGKADTPYTRFLGYAGLDSILDVSADVYGISNGYAFQNTTEISYTFAGANGFSAIVAVLDNPNSDSWDSNFEGGLMVQQGWGSIGAIAGYDTLAGEWGVTAALTGTFGNTTAKLQGFYNSDMTGASWYAINNFGNVAEWSVLGSLAHKFSEKVTLAGTAQWFSDDAGWLAGAEVQYTPVENLTVTPGVHYFSSNGDNFWGAAVRVQRSF
ncbi:MAG TPA: porin [Rhizobiaceae bacterium]|nr:porin [Rhizobiaceae bacterium]